MNLKTLATEGAIIFVVALIVSLVVSYLYGLLVHGAGLLEWESSVRFAIILAIVLAWVKQREKK